MEYKSFELLTKMYSEMTEQFRKINKKLDGKSDKSDIIRMENKQEATFEVFEGGKKKTL